MIDNESLQMIAKLLDEKLEANNAILKAEMEHNTRRLEAKIDLIQEEVIEIKADIAELKIRVSVLEAEVKILKSDVKTLQSDVKTLQSDVKTLQSDMVEVKRRLDELTDGLHFTKLDIENVVKHQISILAENYVPAAKRYENSAKEMEQMKQDISLLKLTVARHSERLSQIS